MSVKLYRHYGRFLQNDIKKPVPSFPHRASGIRHPVSHFYIPLTPFSKGELHRASSHPVYRTPYTVYRIQHRGSRPTLYAPRSTISFSYVSKHQVSDHRPARGDFYNISVENTIKRSHRHPGLLSNPSRRSGRHDDAGWE